MALIGSKQLRLAGHDWKKGLKVAAFVGVSAALTSIAQTVGGWDLSGTVLSVDWLGLQIPGNQVALLIVNVCLYLAAQLVSDTRKTV